MTARDPRTQPQLDDVLRLQNGTRCQVAGIGLNNYRPFLRLHLSEGPHPKPFFATVWQSDALKEFRKASVVIVARVEQ
jgi:hypothetical protein